MSFYNIIDLIIITLILALSIYAYKHALYSKFFDYFKLFVLLTISAKLASTTGILLQKIYILKVDTYAILLLVGFVTNFLLLFYGYKYFITFLKRYINSEKIRKNSAIVISVIEVVFIVSFLIFMSTQLYLGKLYLNPILDKTLLFSYIKSFYLSFLNDDLIRTIINGDVANHKEILFNSFKNSL